MSLIARRSLLTAGLGTAAWIATRGINAQERARESGGMDAVFAMKLLISGGKQIAVCELAKAQLKNEDVLRFAQAEIDEHVEMKKKLKGLGYEYQSVAGSTTPAASDGAFLAQGHSLSPNDNAQLQIAHQVAMQCIATQKAELGKLSGKEADHRFVENQLDAHYELFDHGVVFRKHATSQLGGVLDEARKVIEQHIATCKALCKTVA